MSPTSRYGAKTGRKAGARIVRAETSAKMRTETEPSEDANVRVQPSATPLAPAIPTTGQDDSDPSDVKTRLRQLEADYLRDANPVHAWEAFAIAHRATVDPPWWLTVVVGSAESILKIRDAVADGAPVKREAERVGKALGFGTGGPGRGGWFKHATMLKRDRAIYFEVIRALKLGNKLDFAYDAAVQATNVSRSTIRRAYQWVKKLSCKAGSV